MVIQIILYHIMQYILALSLDGTDSLNEDGESSSGLFINKTAEKRYRMLTAGGLGVYPPASLPHPLLEPFTLLAQPHAVIL